MKIATWNVNSVRSRLDRVCDWLQQRQPDVLCLQEIKVVEESFPFDAFAALGYQAAVHGQKTYNGVAILSRSKPQHIERGLGDDPQARLVGATIEGVRVFSAYFPNGGVVGSDKWTYKLEWIERLRQFLTERSRPDELLAVCGDTNVAIDDLDVANPEQWADSVLCAAPGREALRRICEWGLTDVFRRFHPEGGVFSWWDYRQLAFPKNDGLRIDHILATPPLDQRCQGAMIDRDERKGPKPSDHAPVIADFS